MATYTLAQLKAAVAALAPGTVLSNVDLTPELAGEILTENPGNREWRPGKRTQYTRKLRTSTWNRAVRGLITFNGDGLLTDGQHRCGAVLDAGTSLIVDVGRLDDTFGLNEGIPRTLADYLGILVGIKDKEARIATAKVSNDLLKMLTDLKTPDCQEQYHFFLEHRALVEASLAHAHTWNQSVIPKNRIFKTSDLACYRARLIAKDGETPELVDDVLEDAVSGGAKRGENSPTGYLYSGLSSMKKRTARDIWKRVRGTVYLVKHHKTGKPEMVRLPGEKSPRRRRRVPAEDAA
jgi:hypothetical protein